MQKEDYKSPFKFEKEYESLKKFFYEIPKNQLPFNTKEIEKLELKKFTESKISKEIFLLPDDFIEKIDKNKKIYP